ncbi:MAG TPA: adenylate/guanylate cyclase domain-containing protein [Lichenihabitans sp.]|nr:adenylate/guanylate cyclase domain-containing protein [Lichenihabitans sp.]
MATGRRATLAGALRRSIPFIAGLSIVGLVSGARLLAPEPFDRLQSYGFDTLQRFFPRADADILHPGSGVPVVDIDEASLARYGQWPWSRLVVSRLIANLQDAGAAAIGLDMVFAEPDRTSPATLVPQWRREDGLSVTGPGALPDYDRQLAATLARGRVVTGYGLIAAANGKAPVLTAGIGMIGSAQPAGLWDYAGAVPNLPMLDEAAAGQGSFTIAGAGRDEIIRRLPLVMSLDGNLVPALTLEALRVADGSDDDIRLRETRNGGPRGTLMGYTARVGTHDIPLAPDGTMLLHHGLRSPAMTISAARVLDPEAQVALKRTVAGRIVLIGTSAVGLSDLRPTPLSAFEPGVNIHAGAIEQILGGDLLARPALAPGGEFVAAAALGVVVAGLVSWLGIAAGAGLVLAVIAAALGGTALAFAKANLLLDPSLVALEPLAAFVAAMLARYLLIERRASGLRAAFSQYLSPALVEALARDPSQLRLGGETRQMSFLFTDLEGFTSFTETADPALLVSTLNAYLDAVCGIVMEHGGTVDKIVGDAVHVMFNAPLDQPDHAARAVRCALAIDVFAQGFAAGHKAQGRSFGTTRIGVNTGPAVVGNFGGKRRFDYTAHGDSINTAARLEAANKRLGTRICVAASSVAAAPGLRFRPIGALELKGKSNRVEVFAPLPDMGPENAWAERYADAFGRLSRGEERGAEAILELHAAHPDDPILGFHARRIALGQRDTDVALQAA